MAITKLIKGSGFAGCLGYVMDKEQGEVLHTQGVSSDSDVASIAREMRSVSDSASLSKPVLHVPMSAPHGEQVSEDQWRTAARTWLREMGADPDKVQYVLVRHKDKEHDHVHLVANRVQLDGKTISDQQDFRRSHAAMRVAEREAGMQQYEKPTQQSKKGRMAELRQAIDKALAAGTGLAGFKEILRSQGIEVLANQQKTGRMAGISFKADGHVYKGSSLGKGYSLAGLQKQGLEIQNLRDQKGMPSLSAAKSWQPGMALGQSITRQEHHEKNKRDIDKWLAERRSEAHRNEDQRHGVEGRTEQELE